MPAPRAETAPRDHVAPASERATSTTHAPPRRTRGHHPDVLPTPGAAASTNGKGRIGKPAGDVPTHHPPRRRQVPDSHVQSIMHARLKAMAEPRPSDSPELARLRRLMRDPGVAADLTANVDQWPAPTDEQRDLVAALLQRRRPGR